MKRQTYALVDTHSTPRAHFTQPEAEPVSLEPWMLHKITAEGWRLVEVDKPKSPGVETHGYVDWRMIADNLATSIRPLMDDHHEFASEIEANAALEAVQMALDDYQVAMMEVGVAQGDPADDEEHQPGDEEDDDGDPVGA